MSEKGWTFVGHASAIIANGLLPAVEYVGPGTQAGPGSYDDDRGANLPYAPMRGPDPYPSAGAISPVPATPGSAQFPGPDWRLNRFLDCYIAPVGSAAPAAEAATTIGDADVEGRLLRGHILLTLLARFGTELITSHSSSKQVAQAELLLGHVADAEKSLRTASYIMNSSARARSPSGLLGMTDAKGAVIYATGELVRYDGKAPVKGPDGKPVPAGELMTLTVNDLRGTVQPTLAWYGFTTRLLRVLQVGVDIERIDAQQSLDRAANLIAAFGGALKGFAPILEDGLAGLVTVLKTRIYGDAYLRDARDTLDVARHATEISTAPGLVLTYSTPAFVSSWKLWDAELDDACKVLATIAKKDAASAECVPSLEATAPHKPVPSETT